MNIQTTHATVTVSGTPFPAWMHIDSCMSGYCAKLTLPTYPGGQFYVGRWKEGRELYIFIVPDKEWIPDIEEQGYTILGELSKLAGHPPEEDAP